MYVHSPDAYCAIWIVPVHMHSPDTYAVVRDVGLLYIVHVYSLDAYCAIRNVSVHVHSLDAFCAIRSVLVHVNSPDAYYVIWNVGLLYIVHVHLLIVQIEMYQCMCIRQMLIVLL